jgi:predicted anti-sigma-YlaC factor YlaD
MVSCEVISDLMIVYASGEASAETRRLVEEHVARCPACREAFEREQAVEQALVDLEPVPEPANGRRFIARTRRLLFALGAGALFLAACVLVTLGRVVIEDISGIPLPHLPGSAPLWLAVAAGSLAVYVGLLLWRRHKEPGTPISGVLLSLLTAMPLLFLALAALDVMSTGGALSVVAAALLLLVALLVTFVLLPRLPYATLVVVLVLLLANWVLLGQTAAGVVAVGDFSWQTGAELGHPPEGIGLEDAVRVDLSSLGLDPVETAEVTWVNKVWIGAQAQAVQAKYEDQYGDGDQQARLTAVEFEGLQEADQFFVSWKEAVSPGIELAHFEINLPGLPGQGGLVRTYSAQSARAYSAWRSGSWVTIIEVPGPFSQAAPLAREIKELVASSYQSGE